MVRASVPSEEKFDFSEYYGKNPWPQPEEESPWLDRSDALKAIQAKQDAGEIDAETADRLRYWHEYGYLILPNPIAPDRLDAVMADFNQFWERQTIVGGLQQPLQRNAYGHFTGTINVHMQSDAVKDVFLDPEILRWMDLLFGKPNYGCQTINFFTGTYRALHHDQLHLSTRPYGYLGAAWIALEDIDPKSGPFFYYPGSHWLPYIGVDRVPTRTQPDFDTFVQELHREQVRRYDLTPKHFIARKGEVLLWHSNLIHGGAPIEDARLSRNSMACHYAAFNVQYLHGLTGLVRDTSSNILHYNNHPYLAEYYDKDGNISESASKR